MNDAESTASPWKEDALPQRPPLARHATCDVCVIGSGIAGMSAAYHLAREGRRVIVLDAHGIGAGQTAQTTAHLASALDDRFSVLERVHGGNGARLAYESHARAIDDIESIVRHESIDCNFERLDGYLFAGTSDHATLLDRELAAAERAGVAGVERVPRAPLESFDSGPCLRFPRQARFHPLRYLRGLMDAVERMGGAIYGATLVTEVSGGPTVQVCTRDGIEVRADAAIVATNSPFHPRIALHSKQAPYRTYAIALRIPTGSIHDALYWDTCDPYHYVRIQPSDGSFSELIVGGEDHRTGTADDADARYRRLERWTRERFPIARDLAYRWSGQVFEPFDHLAFIGKDPSGERNVYVATGDSGHGITHGAVAAIVLADQIAGRQNAWADLYDPARKTPRAAGEYLRDNLEVAAEYAKWLMPERRRRPETLALGEGAVVQRGARKIAVYRDPTGELHERSAVCTHLGCIVRWNSDAKSWDCPCHGSRFAPTGEVLNGPAQTALQRVDELERPRGGRVRSALVGGAGGALATVAMSMLMMTAQKLGLVGQMPPKKIVRGLRRRAGVIGVPRRTDHLVSIAAHWGFGVASGALFGSLHRRRSGLAKTSLIGAVYGAAVWATSYYGWVPALGLMRAPHRDRPARPSTMVAAHLLFGSVLGAFVDGFAPRPARPRANRPRPEERTNLRPT